MFWNIGRISFLFFSIQMIKSNYSIIFLNFFQLSFSDEKFIPSKLYFFIKDLLFIILAQWFPISPWVNPTVTAYRKQLLYSFIDRIYCCYVLIQSGESINYPVRFGYILWHLRYNKWTYSKTKSLPSINFPFFYNFICVNINLDFHVITFWIHYTLFIIIIFRKYKVNCYC